MGIGIWSMHFIAMLAVSLPTTVHYSVLLTASSVVFAVAGSGIALYIVSEGVRTVFRLLLGGILLGSGIGAMHYTGMAAMHMDAGIRYDPLLFSASVVVAVLLFCLTLRLPFLSMEAARKRTRALRLASGCVMGLSITAMHYTGMLATYFLPSEMRADHGTLYLDAALMAPVLAVAAAMIIGFALISALIDHGIESDANCVRRSKEFLAAVVNNTADGIIVIDRGGTIRTCNPAARRMFGYDDAELIGEDVSILLPPEARGSHAGYVINSYLHAQTALGARRPIAGQRRDGTRINVEIALSVMETEEGSMFIGVCQDTTERTRMEQERMQAAETLREREAFMRLITNNVPALIIYVDREVRLRFVNKVGESWYGQSQEQLIGRQMLDILGPATYESLRLHVECVLTGEAQHFDRTEIYPDGQKRSIDVAFIPDIASDASVTEFFGIVHDVTDRKEMERQLSQAQKLEAIGQLASGIAHEINTPSQYIGDNLRFLKDAHADLFEVLQAHRKLAEMAENASTLGAFGVALDAVKTAEEAADLDYLMEEIPTSTAQSLDGIQQVSHIVRAMKDFSHHSDRKKAPVDLSKTIANIITISRNSWKYVAELETVLDPNLPLITCVGAEIKQVLLNLVVNAAHAIEACGEQAAGRITITSGLVGGYAEIRLIDTGVGIPEAVREKIFNPFFTTKDVGKGTGQGLSISHDIIVKRHRGRLFFESEEGTGTTFIVQLPLERHAAAVQAAE